MILKQKFERVKMPAVSSYKDGVMFRPDGRRKAPELSSVALARIKYRAVHMAMLTRLDWRDFFHEGVIQALVDKWIHPTASNSALAMRARSGMRDFAARNLRQVVMGRTGTWFDDKRGVDVSLNSSVDLKFQDRQYKIDLPMVREHLTDNHKESNPNWITALPDIHKVHQRYLSLTKQHYPQAHKVFVLFMEGLSNVEIGVILGVSQSRIAQLLPFYTDGHNKTGSWLRHTINSKRVEQLFQKACNQ